MGQEGGDSDQDDGGVEGAEDCHAAGTPGCAGARYSADTRTGHLVPSAVLSLDTPHPAMPVSSADLTVG